MKIFSKHRRKIEPKRRFGSMEFRNKIKEASNYKRAFNPTSGFSLNIFPGNNRALKMAKILGVASILLIGYYLFISPTFLITNITVKGNHQVSAQQIEEVIRANDSRLFMIKKNNFFIMSKGRVNKAITTQIPTVKEVINYNRSLPNRLTIEIVEHTPGFVIESGGNYFLVDDEGIVVNQIYDPEKLLIAHDQLVENFVRGETLSNQKLATFILSMNKSWSSKINVGIDSVKFPGKSSNDVQFVTKAGWTVLFDSARPVSVQLSSLAVMLTKQITQAQQVNLAYIDLRLSKWAYYCFKESPCQQKEQPQTSGTETNVEQ